MIVNQTRDLSFYRKLIDDDDSVLIALLARRRRLSQAAQQVKIDSGQTRTDLKREAEVIDHYRAVLGESGARLAHDILLYSKED